MRATRAIIHSGNLEHNIGAVRKFTGGGTRICLAVKADAYGHGAVDISRSALEMGVENLAVAAVCEAVELRENGIEAPVLLLSPTLPEEADTIAEMDLQPVISSVQEADRFSAAAAAAGRKLSIHLKIDTGMGRIGCRPEEAAVIAGAINRSPVLELSGVCTHFPVSDSALEDDARYTTEQIRVFIEAVESIKAAGIDPGIIHAANSGAILNYPEAHFDMVRPGIMAYGYIPDTGLKADFARKGLVLKPVMTFESRLMKIRKTPAGTDISYGRKYTTPEDTYIGVIPAGYADGYSRSLSNKAGICIRGKLYPVVGTICMDQLMIDLGPEPEAELYDRAVLFGPEDGALTAEDLASMSGTISYEYLCAVSKRVPRIYTV